MNTPEQMDRCKPVAHEAAARKTQAVRQHADAWRQPPSSEREIRRQLGWELIAAVRGDFSAH